MSTASLIPLTVQTLGYNVPNDVAIVGYDGTTEAQLVRPQLTTMRQRIELIAETAAELLLERISQPGAEPRRVGLELELIVCGAA